jgi:hypothetical protein
VLVNDSEAVELAGVVWMLCDTAVETATAPITAATHTPAMITRISVVS